MASKPTRKRTPTKFDKDRQREELKLLVFASGYSIRQAARLAGVNEDTACGWAAKEGWTAQLQRIREMAQISQADILTTEGQAEKPTQVKALTSTAEAVAFDMAATNRQSRAALSQITNLATMNTLKTMTTKPNAIPVESVQDLKALTETAAKIDGTWDDASANRFAVSLNINQMVQSGAIREIDPSVTYIEEGTGKVLYQPPTA